MSGSEAMMGDNRWMRREVKRVWVVEHATGDHQLTGMKESDRVCVRQTTTNCAAYSTYLKCSSYRQVAVLER